MQSTTSTPAAVGEQVGATGEGLLDDEPRPGEAGGDRAGRLVLADILRRQAGDDDLADALARQRRDLRPRPIRVPFFRTRPPLRIEWTAMPPSAFSTGIVPKNIGPS